MANKKVRMGLVGTSSRCHALMTCYYMHPDLEIVACCDTAMGKAENFVGIYQSICGQTLRSYTSYEEMVKKEKLRFKEFLWQLEQFPIVIWLKN